MSDMRSLTLAARLFHDQAGSSLVEFTLVFPIFLLIALGTIDVSYMLFDWALANKAAYAGAHVAIVSDPVAGGITDLNDSYQVALIGDMCVDPSSTTGANSNCPAFRVVCTGAATLGSCTCTTLDSFGSGCLSFTGFDPTDASFATIYNRMHSIFHRLQRQNVTITYQTNNLGFVGQPNGVPMNVTVSIDGMTHPTFFVGPLLSFFGGNFGANVPIPSFATTLTSEDVATN